jgi:hypothetical protein
MFGILLTAIGEVFNQTSTSIGKYEVMQKRESVYAMGFLHAVWTTLFFIIITVVSRAEFIFSFESLPTFTTRLVLELIVTFVSINAVISASRSTFAFLHILTIPLLLGVDMLLGYNITTVQLTGISMIIMALIFLLTNHGLSRHGKFLSILTSILAVGTVSLYKYDITHFNSVVAEQTLTYCFILIFIIIIAKLHTKENVLKYLKKPIFLTQSLVAGLASVIFSFALTLSAPSIFIAVKRSFEVLISIIAGRVVFHEKSLIIKITAFVMVTLGIWLIAI